MRGVPTKLTGLGTPRRIIRNAESKFELSASSRGKGHMPHRDFWSPAGYPALQPNSVLKSFESSSSTGTVRFNGVTTSMSRSAPERKRATR